MPGAPKGGPAGEEGSGDFRRQHSWGSGADARDPAGDAVRRVLLGVFPASRQPLGAASLVPLRNVAGGGALLALLLAFAPPISTSVGHRAWLEALQFGLVAIAVPALSVLAAPQRFIPSLWARLDALSAARQRNASFVRSLGFLALELAAVIGWRSSPAVDAIAAHHALVGVEAVTVIPIGCLLWLEIVGSPPHETRLAPGPGRGLLAAVPMWTIWVTAYLGAFSHAFYPAYAHHGDAAWDQQIASIVLWLTSAFAFVPVVFSVLHGWLSGDERPEVELRRLVREERRRTFVEGGLGRASDGKGSRAHG